MSGINTAAGIAVPAAGVSAAAGGASVGGGVVITLIPVAGVGSVVALVVLGLAIILVGLILIWNPLMRRRPLTTGIMVPAMSTTTQETNTQ